MARLTGVARLIPEVATFVMPVFRGGNGKLLVQRIRDCTITEFSEVSSQCEEQVRPFSDHRLVRPGNLALFGFETEVGKLALGIAYTLAQHLRLAETLLSDLTI